MKLAALFVLALVGVMCAAAGVALIYPPAALIFVGVLCVAVAFVVEVRDT